MVSVAVSSLRTVSALLANPYINLPSEVVKPPCHFHSPSGSKPSPTIETSCVSGTILILKSNYVKDRVKLTTFSFSTYIPEAFCGIPYMAPFEASNPPSEK